MNMRLKTLCTAVQMSGVLLIAAAIAKFLDRKLLAIWLMSETGMTRDVAATIGDAFNAIEFVLGAALIFSPRTAARTGGAAFAVAAGYHIAAMALPQVRLCPCLGGLLAHANPYVLHSALLIVSVGACLANVAVFTFPERASP